MPAELETKRITFLTGGSGSVSIVDETLYSYPNTTSITHVVDDGGHSGESRSTLGLLPPGDATHQLAVHIRDPKIRQLFTHRWKLAAENPFNGHRPGNDFLSAAEKIEKSHSGGIKLLEDAFKAHYAGRVIPLSDADVRLKILLEDGRTLNGEHKIDDLTIDDPPIKDIKFSPEEFPPNPEALEHIANADLLVLAPQTFWVLKAFLKTPGVKEAMNYNRAPIAWYCNALSTAETHRYTTSTMAEKIVQEIDREIDYGFINQPNHYLPPTYKEQGSFEFTNDLTQSSSYIRVLRELPLTSLEFIGEKWVVRHDGMRSCQALFDTWRSDKLRP